MKTTNMYAKAGSMDELGGIPIMMNLKFIGIIETLEKTETNVSVKLNNMF